MRRTVLYVSAFVFLCVFSSISSAFAESGKGYTFRASYFSPKDAADGLTFGASFGTVIDNTVHIGLGFDFYYRNYRKTTDVATQEYESGLSSTTVSKMIQYDTIILPIMLELMVMFPVFEGGSVFGHGGVGYEILWNREKNFVTNVSENRFYGGFGWLLGTGLMFKISSNVAIYIEGFYTNAKPSRSRKDIKKDLPVFEEVNLSGIGGRFGLALFSFR